jgi:putative two-component system response regulator
VEKRILIVDDSEINIEILEELLSDEYEVDSATNGQECLQKLALFSPDMVLLDIMMPGMDGYETCRRIKASPMGSFTQVVMVSGKSAKNDRLKGYQAGADDYVIKPFDHDELLAKLAVQSKMRDAIEQLWHANATIQKFNADLEKLVQERTTEVVAVRDMAVFALAKLADSRDSDTGEHLVRMRNYCQILAEELGRDSRHADQVDDKFLEDMYRSSPLHDIGKVGIPDAILLKPGRLTPEEFEVMKKHTTIGAEALREVVEHNNYGGFLEMAIDIARHHHERFDGGGYPDGLAGADIPLAARIAAVADVYDAVASPRIYKPAFDPDKARTIIEEGEGGHFDPVVVEAFRRQYAQFHEIAILAVSDHEAADLAASARG